MELSLLEWAALADIIASLAVVISLIYVARQVRQGNLLARYQARQNMMEKDLDLLKMQTENPDITASLINPEPTREDRLRLHSFLTGIMRQREWEWFQYHDGVIDEDVYRTYHEVIAIFLGKPDTRYWWNNVGRSGLNPEFVNEVDKLLEKRELTEYWNGVNDFISYKTHDKESADK